MPLEGGTFLEDSQQPVMELPTPDSAHMPPSSLRYHTIAMYTYIAHPGDSGVTRIGAQEILLIPRAAPAPRAEAGKGRRKQSGPKRKGFNFPPI